MKTKKSIALLLAAVMVISVFSISVFASSKQESSKTSVLIPIGYKLDTEKYSVSFDFTGSKVAALDSESAKFTVSSNQNVEDAAGKVYTSADMATLAAQFDGTLGKTLNIPFVLTFESDKVFGTVNYTCTVKGFYKADDSGNNIYKDFTVSGKVELAKVVSFSNIVFLINDNLTDAMTADKYVDTLSFTAELDNSKTGSFSYTPETANMFMFNNADDGKLTVADTSVTASINGVDIATISGKTVSHAYSTEYISISKSSHGKVCEGCGDVIDVQPHTFDNWTSNDDASFLRDATETGVCTVCGEKSTRAIDGTAGYVKTFQDYQFLYVIFDYISLLLDVIYGSIVR